MRARYHAIARLAALLLAASALGCARAADSTVRPPAIAESPPASSSSPPPRCTLAAPVRVRFYDVGQALAALVTLPDGRRVLVDTGELPTRPGCTPCGAWHAHFMTELEHDVGSAPIDLVWITHQHSDHIGGAVDVLERFRVRAYVDNGRDAARPLIARVHGAATARGTALAVVDPDHRTLPFASAGGIRLTPVIPRAFPAACATNPNDCSIALRIDACASSILFVGDAEQDEEVALETGPVTLLQVGHHGSATSTSDGFLEALHPAYAVISAGKPDEGTNERYCHPRAPVVDRLSRVLGGASARPIHAFDGAARCEGASAAHWTDVAASDRLWLTARDGDVTLETSGDGQFHRVP